MIQLTENAIYLPLPIGAHSLHIIGDKLLYMYEAANMPLTLYGEAHIGYGYELLFTTSTIDEEKAKMVVKKPILRDGISLYFDYLAQVYTLKNYIESWESFIWSKSLDTNGNYAILKKV